MISADENTSIQARVRCHASRPPAPRRGKGPGRPLRVEHEYDRGGALAYLAAWDVRRGRIEGRCEATTGKEPFGRLVDQLMQQEPYRSAPRVFWIVDNGSSPRGAKAARELERRYPNLIVVHLPTHASWLNQVEIYFSMIQRKVLTPTTSPTSPPSRAACWPTRRSTTPPPSRSPGDSPAPTSSGASRNSPSRRPPKPYNYS
jgi:hypothetical protein